MERMRVVFYGINGQGLGHLSRLLHMGRALRDLALGLELPVDISFLTSSEAPQIAWDFPVYKIPSKTVLQNSSGDPAAARAHNRFFISNLLGTIRPHQVVMDTQPQGSWGEFTHFRDYCRQRIFVNRAVDPEQALDPVRASHLALYDLIVCPDVPEAARRYPLPDPQPACAFTGAIHGYHPAQVLARKQARQHLAVEEDEKLVYLAAGGGGDPEANQQLQALIQVVSALPKVKLLVAYGPLYRGTMQFGPKLIPYQSAEVVKYLAGVDMAFSAGGYNSYHELRAAGIPTAFFPQPKGLDRQDLRIEGGIEEGWCLPLPSFAPEAIRHTWAKLSTKAVTRPAYQNGAARAAGELLRLYSRLPGKAGLSTSVPLLVYWHGLWQEKPHATAAGFGEVARWALAWGALLYSDWQLAELQEQALMAWRQQQTSTYLAELSQDWLAAGQQLVRLRHLATDLPQASFHKRMATWAKQGVALADLGAEDLYA